MTAPGVALPEWASTPPALGPSTLNAVLYGPPGTGKSTAAATAPGPEIVWVNFDGANALNYPRKVAAERGVEVIELRVGQDADPRPGIEQAVQYAANPTVGTIVFDGVGKLRDAVALAIGGPQPALSDWGLVAKYLRNLITQVRDLDVNSVWICHEQIVEDGDGVIVRPEIDAKGRTAELLMGEVDIVGRTGAYEEDGERKYGAQLTEGEGRRAKDRSGQLGAWRELDLTEWLAVFRDALATDISDTPFGGEEQDK